MKILLKIVVSVVFLVGGFFLFMEIMHAIHGSSGSAFIGLIMMAIIYYGIKGIWKYEPNENKIEPVSSIDTADKQD